MRVARVVAAFLVATAAWALWPHPGAGKGFPLGRDVRVSCDPGSRAELARQGSSELLTPGQRLHPRPIIVGCASLPDSAGTVQLSALPHAPFRGCVLDSYTVGSREGGILCTEFSRAFTPDRRAVGLWITRLAPDGPSVALGAAMPRVSQAYLWYVLESGVPGVTTLATIPVGQKIARRLDASARFSYLAGALPSDTDLCQGTLLVGWTPGRVFGPSPFLDTSLITRTEGRGLTETPRSSRCARRRETGNLLTALGRTLSSGFSVLAHALGD